MYTFIRAVLVVAFIAAGVPVRADIVTLSFVAPTLAEASGSTLTFTGTLTNSTGDDLMINGAGITLSGFGPADTNLTDFILNATGLLSSGASFGPVDLFTVTIPSSLPLGDYPGVLTVQGGFTPADQAVLASTTFEVDVLTPEPSSRLLLTTGFIGVLLCSRRKMRRISEK